MTAIHRNAARPDRGGFLPILRTPLLGPLLSALALVLLPAAAHGQHEPFSDRWRWVRFGTEAGLPDAAVSAVLETPDGRSWAATRRGLAWYDGFVWRQTGPAGIVGQLEPALDPEGRAVLAVIDGRLYRGDTAGVTEIPVPDATGAPARVIGAVPFARDAILVLVVRGARAAIQQIQAGRITDFPSPGRLPTAELAFLRRGPSGRIYLTSSQGLSVWDGAGWQTQLRTSGEGLMVQGFAEADSARLLLFVGGPNQVRGLWEISDAPPHRLSGEGLNAAVALAVDREGTAIAVYETGHVRYRRDGPWRSLSFVPPELRDAVQLSFRRNGDLWAATSSGLYLYRLSSPRWSGWERPFPDLANRVNALLRARDGSLWAATSAGLVVRSTDGGVRTIERAGAQSLGIVTALAEDAEGGIWIGSGSNFRGTYRWDGRSWTRPADSQVLAQAYVHRIQPDRRGRLWFLAVGGPEGGRGPGAFVLDGDVFEPWDQARGLSANRVYSFAEGPDGALWFGSDTGLHRWLGGRWTEWTRPVGYRGEAVFTLAFGTEGRLWFSDRFLGLGYVDQQDSLRYLTTADGLVHDRIWDITSGPRGRLWIATSGGLAIYRDGMWSSFGTDEGLVSPYLWPVLPEENQVLIGTQGRGLQVLDLSEAANPAPRVVVEPPLRDEAGVLIRWRATAYWGQQPPGRIQTRYRVAGQPWSPWSATREALLGLAPGSHRFEVQAKGLFGNLGDVAETSFEIPPPIMLRPWVWLTIAGLLTALVVVWLRARARRRESARQVIALETQLRQAQKMDAVGQLAGGIAHDFNNILAAILANADLLAQQLPEGSEERDDVEEIRVTARRGAAMVKKLLIFSRNRTLELEPVDVAEVAREMSAMLARLISESITIILPGRNERAVVRADRAAIEQILLNLATNSRDAMPKGGELRIRVSRVGVTGEVASREHVAPGTYVRLEVTDTGTGMSDAVRARVFEPFFTTKPPDKGTGLGLAMVYGLVQQLGGSVAVESVPDRGTTVRILLPSLDGSPPTPPKPMVAVKAGRHERILLVEDEPSVRSSAMRLLTRHGYTVETASDGREALARLRTPGERFDLVITDVVMPEMGGPELYRLSRAAGIETRFIFASGYTARALHDGGPPAGLPFLQKPWELADLLRVMRQELDQTDGTPA